MELFQRIVLGIAIILLIAAYIMIFFTLVNNDDQWPPAISNCPDYWVYDKTNDYCTSNNMNNGPDNNISIYPSLKKISQLSKCEKYNWATTNQISWDGLTYGVNMDCPLP